RRHRRAALYAAHGDRPRHRILRHRPRRRGGNDDHRPALRRPARAHHGRADDESGADRGVRAVPGDLFRRRRRPKPAARDSRRALAADRRPAPGAWPPRPGSPNAWLMAPLFIAAAASHLGWIEGRMPDVLLIAAQVLIGSALGAQFRPEFLTRLFRLLWASCLVVLFAAGSMALFAA